MPAGGISSWLARLGTQTEAEAGTNALGDPISSPDAVIYARVTNGDNCFDIAPVTLTVLASPILTNSEIQECDNGNGEGEFDLSGAGIATYYPTLTDAENETNPLPVSYTSATTTIYARVNSTNDCYTLAEVILSVIPPPNVQDSNYGICDIGDGTADVTLADIDSLVDLDGGNIVTYHTTQVDAFLNLNLNYKGRKSLNSKTIHTGSINLKAIF